MKLAGFSGPALAALFALIASCSYHSMGRVPYVEMGPTPVESKASERIEIRCDSLLDPDGMYSEVSEYMLESGIVALRDFKVKLVPDAEKGALVSCIVLEGVRQ